MHKRLITKVTKKRASKLTYKAGIKRRRYVCALVKSEQVEQWPHFGGGGYIKDLNPLFLVI